MSDGVELKISHPWWSRLARPGLRAAAEAMFPPNDLDLPDWRGARLVERTVAYWAELPAHQRRLLVLLYTAIHVLPPLLLCAPLPFGWLSPERRAAVVRRWRGSRIYPVRLLGDAIKATLTMIYMTHPQVLAAMGVTTACAHPNDPLTLGVHPSPFEYPR